MSEYVNEAIIDDTATRPQVYPEEVSVSAPAVPFTTIFEPSVKVYATGGLTETKYVPTGEFQRAPVSFSGYIPPSQPGTVDVPYHPLGGELRDPSTYANSDTLLFQPYGTGGGGGGSQSLDQVLAVGNSVGIYDIDMNGQQLLSLAQIQAKPGDDFNIINASDDVNLAGANVNLTAGSAVNVIATTMGLGGSRIVNVGAPTISGDATNKLYVDTAITNNIANWSSYPAKTAVDISGKDLNNVELITGLPVGGNPIVINNSYNLGNNLPQHALIVAGGFDTTGVEVKPVAVAIKKETLYAGAGDEELGNLNFFGLDDVGDEQLYAQINTFVQDNTKANTDSKMTLGVNVNGTNADMITLDGSSNKVKLSTILDVSGYDIINADTIKTRDISGQNAGILISAPYQLSLSDPCLIIEGGANRTDVSNNGVNMSLRKTIRSGTTDENIGQINFFGLTSTPGNQTQMAYINCSALNSAVGNIESKLSIHTRNNDVMKRYILVDGSNNIISVENTRITNLATPTDISDATTKAYVDSAVSGASQTLAQVLAVGNTAGTNIDMSGNDIIRVSDITNTSGTLNITADDLNLSATGLTSVLNIGSTFGTLITSVGAIDITAGGTTAINSTGNVSIGSLGTTSIENFNLNNSVLTKVPATADLELNNISKINNTGGNIDISATQVNVESFQFNANNLSAPGATRLFLDDVEAVNNDAVGGRIDITSAIVAANNFEFSGSQLASSAADFDLQNIGTLNSSTEGSDIVSKATIVANQTLFSDPTGFKTQLTATTGTAIGFHSDATTATAVGEIAIGAYIAGTEANNTDGNAVGLSVQTILGGLGTGNTATGVEVWGSMTGTTKRGFYEHSSSANVQNTFMNKVGIGADPSGVYMLDVSGQANITSGVGGRANPTLTLETTSGAAPGAYLQFYHNSTTPAVGDRAGVMDMYANNASATKYEVARIRTIQQDNTAGAEDGSIELWASKAGTITQYMDIDGSNNGVIINPNKNITGASFTIYDSQGVTTNNVLMNADCSNANVMFKNYPQRYIFDICNNYTLILPNSFNTMRILAFGAGGGGGSGRKGTSSCFGGGAGAGGNGVELWYDRRELQPDASGSITLYITPGKGGDGGAAVSTAATNGNNGSAGGITYVNLNGFGAGATQRLIPDTATSGGNGGSGGTGAAGTGGTAATFSSDRNIGSQGRAGASSSITGQPARNTTALLYNGSVYSQTGGSGAGGGIDSAGTTQYQGGIFVSPVGQKYNGLGANVNKGGAAGTAGGTPGGDGSIVTFDNITSAAVKPLAGMGSLMGGGGASIGGNGGAGGGWTYGTAGSRGDGGGGGGATGNASSVPSGAGGRGADGFVYITVW